MPWLWPSVAAQTARSAPPGWKIDRAAGNRHSSLVFPGVFPEAGCGFCGWFSQFSSSFFTPSFAERGALLQSGKSRPKIPAERDAGLDRLREGKRND
jgi:hypothetical protein